MLLPLARMGFRITAIALLNTFSGRIVMEPANREHHYREIRRRVAVRPDGRLTRRTPKARERPAERTSFERSAS